MAQIAVLDQKILDNDRQAKQALTCEQGAREKLSRELQRLKEHLLLIEETSTTEAVEAEKRETELRERIRLLENSVTVADSDAAKTTQTMKAELSALQERVVVAEESAEDWKSRFETEKRLRSETNDALTSLQVVVRELSADHERETADASHRNMQLQDKIHELTSVVETMHAEMERLSLDKQTVEDLLESAKSTINSRQKVVEDLEVQLEELRASSRLSTESYRIDDATLRQLFLNYFTAPVDKRPDIALLLASILEYPPEDMEKVGADPAFCKFIILCTLDVLRKHVDDPTANQFSTPTQFMSSSATELTSVVETMHAEMERLSLDKQTVEDLLESAKSTINSRQKVVEDLEVQLEELRASSRLSTESYRIDDATLRQLFLNYFTAPADKRPDIALLLASILEYPPDDMEKVGAVPAFCKFIIL
ncbi:hypothetical protein OESDEN_03286 [Oesophagostomum dentatum]|uniref:GRIP domain-containing protein n=1 Tax=Oesophagostomum dentatum TaxID=61180 RepID=A0A0B1THM7_OESDE|nr:hypothetical protein OESDEN_03286 [Oesophagostomum dentatum]